MPRFNKAILVVSIFSFLILLSLLAFPHLKDSNSSRVGMLSFLLASLTVALPDNGLLACGIVYGTPERKRLPEYRWRRIGCYLFPSPWTGLPVGPFPALAALSPRSPSQTILLLARE